MGERPNEGNDGMSYRDDDELRAYQTFEWSNGRRCYVAIESVRSGNSFSLTAKDARRLARQLHAAARDCDAVEVMIREANERQTGGVSGD